MLFVLTIRQSAEGAGGHAVRRVHHQPVCGHGPGQRHRHTAHTRQETGLTDPHILEGTF